MNDNKYWGNSPYTFDELQDSSIECAWVDEAIRWVGFGMVKVKERPDGEQKIEVICEDRGQGMPGMKVVSIPPDAFSCGGVSPDKQACSCGGVSPDKQASRTNRRGQSRQTSTSIEGVSPDKHRSRRGQSRQTSRRGQNELGQS